MHAPGRWPTALGRPRAAQVHGGARHAAVDLSLPVVDPEVPREQRRRVAAARAGRPAQDAGVGGHRRRPACWRCRPADPQGRGVYKVSTGGPRIMKRNRPWRTRTAAGAPASGKGVPADMGCHPLMRAALESPCTVGGQNQSVVVGRPSATLALRSAVSCALSTASGRSVAS